MWPNCCCGGGTEPCTLHSLSVIDEADGSDLNRNASDWAEYRRRFGSKAQFYIMQPYDSRVGTDAGRGWMRNGWPFDLGIPSNYDGYPPVTTLRSFERHGGQGTGFAMDWYNGLNFGGTINKGHVVSVFIDTSGSMVLSEVEMSVDLLISRLANHVAADTGEDYPVTVANGRLLYVYNGSERWIYPHLDIRCEQFESEEEEPA